MSAEPFKEVPEAGHDGLNSWKQIQDVIEANFRDHSGWLYRGQRNSAWPLSTAIERALQATDMDLSQAWNIEGGLLRRFQRQAHHFNIPLPPAENIPDWLSWMQHFGAPTRLLDWTYSFYVGLYFAVKDLSQSDDGEAALWAVDWRWLESEIAESVTKIFNMDRNVQKQEHFRELLGPDTEPGILKINAFQLNPRLVVQQGTFLVPRQITMTFQENLSKAVMTFVRPSRDHVMKVRISSSARNEVIRHLIRMNVHEASLFPDLQGFASSLKHLLVYPEILAPAPTWMGGS